MSEPTPGGYREVHQGAAWFDGSSRGKVELTGPEAAVFLHNLLTNDVKGLAAGSGCEALLCNVQARVLGRALVFRLGDAYWLDVDPGFADKVTKHLDRHLISERVEIANRTQVFAQLHLAGPGAAAILAKFGLPDVPLMGCTVAPGLSGQVRRTDVLGVPGYDLLCDPTGVAALTAQLADLGATPGSAEAFEVLRVEAGTPVYGTDIDEGNLAPEVGRTGQAISYAKGCYLGQEPIVRVRDLGHVNRVLTGLKFARAEPAPRGSKLWRDGNEAGHVTSSVFSPGLGAAIALAYVRRGHSDPGTPVDVEAGSTQTQASVASLPFSGFGA